MTSKIKLLEEKLKDLERWESQGYVQTGDSITIISQVNPSQIFFHFKLKEDLRKQISEIKNVK